MLAARKKKIVILGMTTRMPVAGNIWVVAHYLEGFRRLGFDPYYVEAHARTPTMLMEHPEDDSSALAAKFIDGFMRRFDLGANWAFHALHDDGRCYGMSDTQLRELYQSADLIINLHGGTVPLPEHYATGRLIYLETDPVETEIEVYNNQPATIEFLEPHVAFFTWGGNYNQPDCRVPQSERFPFKPSWPPVVCDFWENGRPTGGDTFTTIGNWRQAWHDVTYQGEVYYWSKHREYLKFIDLPRRIDQPFELALASYEEQDQRMLEEHGWRVVPAMDFSADLDAYRHYIQQSRGEFTVAKDQNVRLRSGWFSERSAQYLAAGRPVVTQETGFSNVLPSGRGLFGFLTLDEIIAAVESINADYPAHCRAAAEIAREYFNYDKVLGKLLDGLGLNRTHGVAAASSRVIPDDLDLRPISRWPTTLSKATVESIMAWPTDLAGTAGSRTSDTATPHVSLIVLTHNNLAFTKLCLQSVLANTALPDYEIVVIDNGSTDGTVDYLRELASLLPHVRPHFNAKNLGFAAGNNQGLAIARGKILVLLNNDVVVPSGWLERLVRHLDDRSIGAVGPVTNCIGNEAQIATSYRTYGEMVRFADDYVRSHCGEQFPLEMLVMFCLAMRREVFEQVGPLDERFEMAMFEDDDYSMRLRGAGYRLVCAEDSFVHHFGQASIGKWAASSEYGQRFHANRARWEEKWQTVWEPHRHRPNAAYEQTVSRVRDIVASVVPEGATVLVINKGDEGLLEFEHRRGWHFPRNDDGSYPGFNPADDAEAVRYLETLRGQGANFLAIPAPSLWWLDYYQGFRRHIEDHYRAVFREDDACAIYELRPADESSTNCALAGEQAEK